MQLKTIRLFVIGILVSSLTACLSMTPVKDEKEEQEKEKDSAPTDFNWNNIKTVTPRYEPKSRYGNPPSYEQDGITYRVMASANNYKKKGVASWYGTKFHGRRTSSGETYDMFTLTAAHKTLPIPCYAKVKNLDNGKSIIVKINDRGPFKKNRIIDLSYAAAHKLGMASAGTANVLVETISFSKSSQLASQNDKLATKRFVQVGAYSNHAKAQKLAKVLDREIRLPVKITTVTRKGTRLYRVRIGPVASQEMAEQLVSTLDLKELGTPKIVYQ